MDRDTVVPTNATPSMAARCIEIRTCLTDATVVFRPEYAHQCFDGDTIRGYRPPLSDSDNDKDSDDDDDRSVSSAMSASSSSSRAVAAVVPTKQLAVTVHLAPSGRTCAVRVDITNLQKMKKRRPRQQRQRHGRTKKVTLLQRPATKKRRILTVIQEEKKSGGSSTTTDDEDDHDDDDDDNDEGSCFTLESRSNDSGDDDDDVSSREGVTRKRPMPVAEILHRLASALPTIVKDATPVEIAADYLRRAVGTVVMEYSRDKKNATTTTTATATRDDFVLTLANGTAAAAYHNQVQRLAVLFIETADEVNVADCVAGHWKVLYLFRKLSSTKFALAGYVTLFFFTSPFRKPVPGTVVRICQALLLPPYQRAGHGLRLLQAVHNLAHNTTTTTNKLPPQLRVANVVEINVEDPAPAFCALRNRADYEQFLQQQSHTNVTPWIDDLASAADDPVQFLAPLDDVQIVTAATRAKITTKQIQIVHEIHQWQWLQDVAVKKGAAALQKKEALEKQYRLNVKRRLHKVHREELSACRTQDEMKATLQGLYEETLAGYRAILASVQRQQERDAI